MNHLFNNDEYQPELELRKPSHIYDLIDSQREQDKSDDQEVGVTEDPLFASRNPAGQQLSSEIDYEELKYKQISLPPEDSLLEQTRKLVPEQLDILEDFVDHCKKLKKERSNPDVTSTAAGMLAICHGGAGVGKSATIKVISLWVEKILRSPGQNPNHPRVIICAPTGKAASLVSKFSLKDILTNTMYQLSCSRWCHNTFCIQFLMG